jgi:hypothetical protein
MAQFCLPGWKSMPEKSLLVGVCFWIKFCKFLPSKDKSVLNLEAYLFMLMIYFLILLAVWSSFSSFLLHSFI